MKSATAILFIEGFLAMASGSTANVAAADATANIQETARSLRGANFFSGNSGPDGVFNNRPGINNPVAVPTDSRFDERPGKDQLDPWNSGGD